MQAPRMACQPRRGEAGPTRLGCEEGIEFSGIEASHAGGHALRPRSSDESPRADLRPGEDPLSRPRDSGFRVLGRQRRGP